jgi:hypothetical protein
MLLTAEYLIYKHKVFLHISFASIHFTYKDLTCITMTNCLAVLLFDAAPGQGTEQIEFRRVWRAGPVLESILTDSHQLPPLYQYPPQAASKKRAYITQLASPLLAIAGHLPRTDAKNPANTRESYSSPFGQCHRLPSNRYVWLGACSKGALQTKRRTGWRNTS